MRSFLLSQQQQAFRLIWITDVYRQDVSGQKLASYGFRKKKTLPKTLHSETPKKLDQGKTVSIRGQLMYREFFYTVASSVNNFTKMEGNRICRQIDWYENEEQKTAWREGRTGYPWIDAIIRQMILEGNWQQTLHGFCTQNKSKIDLSAGYIYPV